MKWKDSTPREYYSKYEKVNLKNAQGWFEVYRLPGDVYAICEPQHFQEVNAYLIVGTEQSVLFDTGMGICNIKAVVSELCSNKVAVVNSHFHFDHIGDNHRFNEIYIFDDPYAKAIASVGLTKEGMGNQLDEDMFLFGYPEGFEPNNFRIKPYKVKTLYDGYRFDLGNRSLEVIHTPGHSNDSIMLFDNGNKILFTGDTFYLGALYAHFDCNEFGKSNIGDYYATMKNLFERCPDVKALYCSHNDFIVEPVKIAETTQALKSILNNQEGDSIATKSHHAYLENQNRIKEYKFDGFSIVVKS
ncbi:MBL fold metallo-hydrolase [Aminipila butyrica]|uniref:MBL fold metallo-hydrolase n=1 Tax=Aminipila butyrica TaxID=433296 RepID=A0A858BTE7_9FIRM|nr:MBL fold metallo-hydrolase [Aminipila butyrica]QIB68210.1 MBL fold metallo-hydrolase [Aminipila butyrica]